LISLNYSPPWLRFGAFAFAPRLQGGWPSEAIPKGAAWIFDWAGDFGYWGRGPCSIEGDQGTRAEIGGRRMTLLMYFMAFGWTLVLFASLIGLTGWLLVKLYRGLTEPPDPRKQTARSRDGWDLNRLKRAGQ
jgi:hypothetical protein